MRRIVFLSREYYLRKVPVWWVMWKPFLVFSLSLDPAKQSTFSQMIPRFLSLFSGNKRDE